MRPEHLELPPQRVNMDKVHRACLKLQGWHEQKTPAGKLKHVGEFIRELQRMLADTAEEGNPDGADILLPAAIFALL